MSTSSLVEPQSIALDKKKSAMNHAALLFLLVILLTGCGKNYWLAKYYLYVAEQNNYKAHVLRTKKDVAEEQRKYHRKACDYFLKAYAADTNAFNFIRCEYAAQSCEWVDDFNSSHQFRMLQQQFQEPEEYEPAPLPSS